MKSILAFVFTTILIVGMALGAMFILVRATLFVSSLVVPIVRAVAIAAELFLGVVLLLGTVWLATQLAVHTFGGKEAPTSGGPLA